MKPSPSRRIVNGWGSVLRVRDESRLRSVINPRRGVVNPVPGPDRAPLPWSSYFRVRRQILERYGLEKYDSCITAEPYWRPLPHLTPWTEELRNLQRLYASWVVEYFARVSKDFQPVYHTFNKISRTGWPHFNRPPSKRVQVLEELARVRSEGIDDYCRNMFKTANVRLQVEPPDKERDLQVLTPEGKVVEVVSNAAFRTVVLPDGKRFVGSRVRPVYNYPELNLVTQALDTAIGSVIGGWRISRLNLYDPNEARDVRTHFIALDVKHMERATGAIAPIRTEALSGDYALYHGAMNAAPFCVPSKLRNRRFYLADPGEDWLLQFGSGHSAVSDIQKEGVHMALAQGHVDLWGYSRSAALEAVISGNSKELNMKNFGDDNFISSESKEHVEAMFAYLARYFPVAREDPPKLLGFVYYPALRRFFLSEESYILRTYFNERPPLGVFRKYAYLGWKLKRATYLRYGREGVMGELFDFENQLLAKEGLSWSYVEEQAELEARHAEGATPNVILGRDYAMTEAEKLASGMFEYMTPAETLPLCRRLAAGGVLNI